MNSLRFLTDTPADIALAAHTLADGALLGLPTETVYGLAADALNPKAVAAVFHAKGRPADHPLIVHVVNQAQVPLFASDVPAFARALMDAYWPGPLTLILPRRAGVADAAAGGHDTIALRCPSHPLAQQVLLNALALGVQGVAAPSANVFGRVSPTTAAHVRQAFPDLPVLDGGACDVGIESTIVDASRGSPFLLRPGMLTPAQLSEVCGMPVSRDPVTASGRREAEQNAPGSRDSLASPLATPGSLAAPPAAPGNLASHYAPRARLRLMAVADMATALQISPTTHVALWLRSALAVPPHTKLLPMPGDAAACAHDLFARLHELDAAGVDEIWVETPPADAAWDGVRDRLQRASA